jgi:hypothetical protein
MAAEVNRSNSELISLLEREMLDDLSAIDLAADDEFQVTEEVIHVWYTETEKVVRVLANLFAEPAFQPINQLRYAGHHILKAQINEHEKVPNLLEAYKHCKRALFDAFDYYIYRLTESYKEVLPYFSADQAEDIQNRLKVHVLRINGCRGRALTRIEYYSEVYDTFIDGLNIVEDLNQLQQRNDLRARMDGKRQELEQNNRQLRKSVDALTAENNRVSNSLENNGTRSAIIAAVAGLLGMIIGPVAAAWLTVNSESSHNLHFSNELKAGFGVNIPDQAISSESQGKIT